MARILIVERVPFMRNVTRFALEYGGHTIIQEAEDGQEAVDFYKKCKPDLVILELMLQKITGMQVLETIKGIDPDARVIICSTVRQQRMIDLAMDHCADSYIVKPFQIPNFLREVNRVLGIEEIPEKEGDEALIPLEKEDLEKIAAKVLTKTISPEEMRSFLRELNR
ncbi:MAG TPA: response regulator [Methanospirillum sp.]|nr:response regulator [Methanospirillum sp.]